MEYVIFKNNSRSNLPADGSHGKRRQNERRKVQIWMAGNSAAKALPEQPTTSLVPGSHCIINLSPEGAYITGRPLRSQARIQLQFCLPNRFEPVKVQGKVVWSWLEKEQKASPHAGMGVQFSSIKAEDREAIKQFLYGLQGANQPSLIAQTTTSPPVAPAAPTLPKASMANRPLQDLSEDEIDALVENITIEV